MILPLKLASIQMDIWDANSGKLPPAYAVLPPLSGLASAHLAVALGLGAVGIYSLITGEHCHRNTWAL